MKTMSDRTLLVLGLLASNVFVSGVDARTIVVNSDDAAVFAESGRYLIDHAVGGSRVDANMPTLRTSFDSAGALSGLYNEASRRIHDSAYVRDEVSMKASVQHDDVRVMLLIGAVLIAQQLRRKHRSLKQSLIAG